MAKKLFVGGLPYATTEQELQDLMAKAGTVESAVIVMNKMTGESKGFGFVSFLDFKECADALRTMAGNYIGTRPIMLKVSTNNKNSRSRKKGKRGSYRGGKGRGGGRRHHR